ncbi:MULTISPECIES: hypothetical protein [Dinoroseobacter]|jgi:hypothetical protein|uniref:hypothetical protein n=1 Tax=Dinoroseobacter TaxID=309512 RepID=UPI0000E90685|nr:MULTISPECIES: hypothetical protein [Dinoroseobacter]MDD9715418.1 hypothetical protein [Dinoroseobacter sp. PD6]URF48396.1 hypothetical protein M8008_09000 [Dinoroseobacter shibae]URF52706.1 hypothetical protein M8007_09000 [Dinoroseobacter shibae]
MTSILNTIRSATAKRIAYVRTVSEIQAMPWEVAHDLDIDRTKAREIARKTVYGY